MPNTGKPSRNCHLCRARRVKCDLTRPGCTRCAKLGKICPGYRPEADLLFRNENAASFTKPRAVVRRKSRSQVEHAGSPRDDEQPSRSGSRSPSSVESFSSRDSVQSPAALYEDKLYSADLLDGEDSSVDGSVSNELIVFRPPSDFMRVTSTVPLFAPMPHRWEDFCIPLVLERFSVRFRGTRLMGLLESLPDLYQGAPEDSCLALASQAVAMACWNNEPQSTVAVSDRAWAYVKALRSINMALQDPLEGTKDNTVIAIWLVGIYEILVGAPDGQPFASVNAWHAHLQGLTTLLRLRGREQFSTNSGRNIFRLIYKSIQTRCLGANFECPKESLEWFELLQASSTQEDEPAFILSVYAYKVSRVLPRIRKLVALRDIEQAISRAPSILTECDTIEDEVLAWLRSTKLLFRMHPGNLSMLPTWNFYRAVRCKLHYSLFAFFGLLKDLNPLIFTPEAIQANRQNSHKIVLSMTDEILESIPYALGGPSVQKDDLRLSRPRAWPDALQMLWPLHIVSLSPLILPHQIEVVKKAFRRIGHDMGIRQALISPVLMSMKVP